MFQVTKFLIKLEQKVKHLMYIVLHLHPLQTQHDFKCLHLSTPKNYWFENWSTFERTIIKYTCKILLKSADSKVTNKRLDVFEKNACLPPRARSSVRAVEGRQTTRYDRFETEAFIRVRRTCTYIYEHQEGLSSYEVWSLWVKGYLRYWAETVLTIRVTVT